MIENSIKDESADLPVAGWGLFQVALRMQDGREPTPEDGFAITAEYRKPASLQTKIELVTALADGRLTATGIVGRRATKLLPGLPADVKVGERISIPRELWALHLTDIELSRLRVLDAKRDSGVEFTDVRVGIAGVCGLTSDAGISDENSSDKPKRGRPKTDPDEKIYADLLSGWCNQNKISIPTKAEAVRLLAAEGNIQEAQLNKRLRPLYDHLPR